MPIAPVFSRAAGRLVAPVSIVVLQFVAAVYFVIDGIDDVIQHARDGFGFESMMECLVAFALLAGVMLGSRYIAALTRELRFKERSLASAKGAIVAHITVRFQEWGLTKGETEVGLFALKGCDIAEIARLRNAAPGTVRSQLSQIYTKAGVTSQTMLLSLFIDDLIDIDQGSQVYGSGPKIPEVRLSERNTR